MPKGTVFDHDFLMLTFNAATVNGWARDAADGYTNLYVALHSADPSGSGYDQTRNELTTGAYNTYARVAVARTGAGWVVTNNAVSPAATVSFAAMVSGTGVTATHWSVGCAASGASKMLYSGAISPTIVISAGVTPQLTVASTITET
jgi:hypothetical protein